jgi:hypothetical protein
MQEHTVALRRAHLISQSQCVYCCRHSQCVKPGVTRDEQGDTALGRLQNLRHNLLGNGGGGVCVWWGRGVYL